MELVVRLMIEAKDEGRLPTNPSEVVLPVQDVLADSTKHDAELLWRITRVDSQGELIGRRVSDSDGISTGERVER